MPLQIWNVTEYFQIVTRNKEPLSEELRNEIFKSLNVSAEKESGNFFTALGHLLESIKGKFFSKIDDIIDNSIDKGFIETFCTELFGKDFEYSTKPMQYEDLASILKSSQYHGHYHTPVTDCSFKQLWDTTDHNTQCVQFSNDANFT